LSAALIAAVTLASSCATAPPPVSSDAARAVALQHATEETVADYISAQLNADPVYYYRHVNVSVDEGVATLSGYVWDAQAIYRARMIASAVPGITRVLTGGLELERNGRDTGPAR
jgi:alpha-D-ribose 1-methylphosphonate 5-triphosphate synthase subunit PhnH